MAKRKPTLHIKGELEIDLERGVVYFHPSNPRVVEKHGPTILRVCQIRSDSLPLDIISCNGPSDHNINKESD